MSTRRGNGEGSIYQRGDTGRWLAAITVQTPEGRRRKWLSGVSRREVQEKLSAASVARRRGTLAFHRPTLAEFLNRWLSRERRLRTQQSYVGYCRLHITPTLGHIRIDDLTVSDVAEMLKAKLDAGLSPQTVAHIRAVLRAAISDAEREELVFRNVARIAKLPAPVQPYEGRTLDLLEAKRFLAAAASDRLAALYSVVLTLGLRQGEALALSWDDVDLELRTLHIRHTLQRVPRVERARRGDGEGLMSLPTKTRLSKQKLPIPEICVRALRSHRARQLEERLAAGPDWQTTGYVFTTPTGSPLHARDVTVDSFRAICERAGIPWSTRERQRGPAEDRGLRFYDLRHSCASLLISDGVPLRVVQDILRHASYRTTADRYTHLVPQVLGEALASMDRTLLDPDTEGQTQGRGA